MTKTVKPLTGIELKKVVDYFLNFTPDEDLMAGANRKNYPSRKTWIKRLLEDTQKHITKRQFFYLGWFLDKKLIGHCNINKIAFGKEAYIHLHLWERKLRRQGLATHFLVQATRFYFKNFRLQKISCEPKSDNTASKKVLEKCGFILQDTYITKPSMLSIEHEVSRYELLGPR
jgi:RimJ/RimL family protein N-acetyltransferase